MTQCRIVCLRFFFSAAADHRTLHSFPTRRSSDLYTAPDALDLIRVEYVLLPVVSDPEKALAPGSPVIHSERSEEYTSELQSLTKLVCRLRLEKKIEVMDTRNQWECTKMSVTLNEH